MERALGGSGRDFRFLGSGRLFEACMLELLGPANVTPSHGTR